MKTKLICWFDNKVLEHCKDFLIENQITPLCADRGIALDIALKTVESQKDIIWEYSFENAYPIQCYLDEILSVPNDDKGNKRVWEVKDNVIYGETSLETISQLVDAGCKSISFTCYGWHLFRIFGLNIRMPFTTQIRTWEKLQQLYGDVRGEFYALGGILEVVEYYSSKFTFCWIMLDQTRHFKKLIEWCITHNKTIGLVAPDSKQNNPEWVKEHLELFINAYKEVVK